MKRIYFHNGKDQFGPYDIEELKSLNISQDTQVWYDGLSSWQPAGHVEELKSLFSSPPAFKTSVPPIPQQLPTPDSATFKTGKVRANRLWLFAGILLIIPIGLYFYKKADFENREISRQDQQHQEEDTRTRIRENITSYVTANRNNYKYSNLGGIYGLQISVSNNTDYLLDNVKVKINYIKSDGNVWNDKIIDFNFVTPHKKITIPIEDTNRGVRIEYEIISIKSTSLGL